VMSHLVHLKDRMPLSSRIQNAITTRKTSRVDQIAIVFCFLALAAALVLSLSHQIGYFEVETDFYGNYAPNALDLLDGKGYSGRYHPPGYPLLLSAAYLLTGDLFLSGKIISSISFFLLGLITYSIYKRIFSPQVGLVTLVLTIFALSPASYLAATDVFGALFFTLPIWLLLTVEKPGGIRLFIGGALGGAAFLLRTNNITIIAGIFLALMLVLPASAKIQKRFLNTGIFLLGALLVVTPWLIYSYFHNGYFIPSDNYLQIGSTLCLGESGALGTEIGTASLHFTSLRSVLTCNPGQFIFRYVMNILVNHPNSLFAWGIHLPAYLFVGAGFLFLFRDLSPQKIALLLAYLPGYLLLGLVGFQLRFYYFIYPLLFAMAAVFLLDRGVLTDLRISLFRRRFAVSWAVVIVIAAITSTFAAEHIMEAAKGEPRYILEDASFLMSVTEPGETVIARKPHLAFLAGARTFFPLANNPQEFLAAAMENGVRVIVYSDTEAALWPNLRTLRDPEQLSPEFHLLYEGKNDHLLIYQIVY
jgi:hypothetical protein